MTLIKADDYWLVWSFVIILAAFSIYAEQKWKWGAKVTSVLIALIGGLIFVNFKIIPSDSPVFASINGYIMPLAIPLLLFQSNLKKIYKESGKLFILFHIACIASVIGGVTAGFIMNKIENVKGLVAMEVGAGTGGGVNLVAMAQSFNVDPNIMNASVITGNIVVLILMICLVGLSSSKWMQKIYKHPIIDEVNSETQGSDAQVSGAALFWKRKEISLLDIAKCLATTFFILGVTQIIIRFVNASALPGIIKTLFGNMYLVLTLVTVSLVTIFPKYFEQLSGADEIGNFMIILFFVSMGCAANIIQVIKYSPVIIVFKILMLFVNILVTMILGKVFKVNLEELLICINASYGGPTTASAMAVSLRWKKLIAPAMLVGTYGYIVGNYFAIFASSFF